MPDILISPIAPPFAPSTDDFCVWLGDAVPGDRFEYHRGFLCLDRSAAAHRLPDCQRRQLEELANFVMTTGDNQRVSLVQQRFGIDDYSYIAIKTGVRL